MMNGNFKGYSDTNQPGLLRSDVISMINRADPKLVSQEILDRNNVTAQTGVTAAHIAVGADAGRIILHPALANYSGDPSTTVHRLRTGNPNCFENERKKTGEAVFFSVSKSIISYLNDKPNKK